MYQHISMFLGVSELWITFHTQAKLVFRGYSGISLTGRLSLYPSVKNTGNFVSQTPTYFNQIKTLHIY